MKEYKRYTIKEGATLPMSQWGGRPCEYELYRKLAELEDKIENGTLIELPRKVNDNGWVINTKNEYSPQDIRYAIISEIRISYDNTIYYEIMDCNGEFLPCEIDEFYSTEEQAKAKLRTLKK